MIPLKVRPAVAADLDDICILYKLACEETSEMGGYPLQKDVAAWSSSFEALREALTDEDRVIFVAEYGEAVVGFGMGAVFHLEAPYEPQTIGKSIYTYILPQFRGGSTAKELGLAKAAWCKSRGAKFMEAYVIDSNRARILMERTGYKKFGYELRYPL